MSMILILYASLFLNSCREKIRFVSIGEVDILGYIVNDEITQKTYSNEIIKEGVIVTRAFIIQYDKYKTFYEEYSNVSLQEDEE